MIKFCWWNTSLSHRNRQNISDKDKVIVWNTITKLLKIYSLDVLVLAEVREDDIKDIYKNCTLSGYTVEYECSRVGKTWFDLCIIIKNSITLESKLAIHVTKLNKTHKIGVRFDLLLFDKTKIHLFASHWQSKLQQDSIEKRNFNAHTLRTYIDNIFKDYRENKGNEPYIILMGDFNDEPFEKSISYCLQSSRDERLVKEKENLFFNPFWKNLSRQNNDVNIGTCYYKSGDLTKWKTFDQIMYSHAFIKSTHWKFVNINDRIIADEDLIEVILSDKSKLDHLPVFGIIKKQI